MIEIKQFAGGGLNQDVDENFLKPNDWTNALNIRNTDRLEGSDGIISNVKGNTLVTYTLPAGTNKCIGAYADEQNGFYYSFIYNSSNNHRITKYNIKTGAVTTVLQASYLNFQQYELINGVGIVGGTLLYWTDGYNPPRGIDVVKAETDALYYTDSASISLIKRPPQRLIVPAYTNDTITTTSSNRLKGQLFQFRYLYVYEDNTRSAWSSCSVLPYPVLEVNSAVDVAPYRNNNIVLQFHVGTKYVKAIEIAAQVKGVAPAGQTQDWFSILNVDRSFITGAGSSEYSYDSLTGLATFKFYNNALYQSVDVLETDLQYDFVPLTSKCLDIVNGNVLVLGNNKEGYDNITPNVTLTTTYVDLPDNKMKLQDSAPGVNFIFLGIPVVGDVLTTNYTINSISQTPVVTTITGVEAGSLYGACSLFANQIAATGHFTINEVLIIGTSVRVSFIKVNPGTTSGLTITFAPQSAVTDSTPGWKTNSKYQLGLVYYDDANRSTYVQTNNTISTGINNGCIVQTKSWGDAAGKVPNIAWTISHSAPTWATKYQWVRTEQLTHKTFLFWVSPTVAADPLNANNYILDLTSLKTYQTKNPNTILAYQFSEGDRCTVHSKKVSGVTTWVTGYDVSVVGFNETSNLLTIQANTTKLAITDTDILIEIYTPKTRSNTSQEQFYYEFGVVYDCTNGTHSTLTGTFLYGDIYDAYRTIPLATPEQYLLEDPNFSDFYVSNFSANGRANIFAPQAKQLTLPTDVRFSDTYVPNTNINGLTRFYGEAFETYDRVNGSIQKLAVRDNYLMTFQELKTGYIPILQSIIEDQGSGNNANVAISNKLLNKIRYFPGDYGIGTHPESFARFAGTMYFADPNRGEVIKLEQGLQPISKLGMDSYFTSKLSYTNNITNAKILGSYDPRNDEYIISFRYVSGTDQETIAFAEQTNRWTTFYSFIPDFGNYIFNQYITYKDGAMYTHNTNSVYGSFYGVTDSSMVELVYNASPSLIKTFIGVMQQSTSPWVPLEISTSNVQASELATDNFTLKEGVWFASLLREKTVDPTTLYFGNDLKGNWIRLKSTVSGGSKETLLAMDVRHIPSYQGIK